MHYLSEENILLFLLQVAILLGLARALGEVFRRHGQPTITAEILVGVLLGPTLLGRALPGVYEALFPDDGYQKNMLETVAWLGILFFLLKSGLETNFATAWRQRKQAMTLSLCDLTIPMVVAFVPCLFLPTVFRGGDAHPAMFALFIATIMTISALPVTARVLQDLQVYRTDMGLLIMSALTINDVAGWIVFAIILGFLTNAAMSVGAVVFIVVATIAFAAICLSVGSRLLDKCLLWLNRWSIPEPAGSLTLICVVGMLCGAITTWIGIHALFGFFIAGILAGESTQLSQHTRHIFSEMVQAILVPLFFASIGLKLDFLNNIHLPLIGFILVIGIAGRYVAAFLGSRWIGQPSLHSRLIADAHIPGGEMQIVIGMLALEYGVITETVYVAVVVGAIVSSMISGPLMGRLLRRILKVDWLAYLPVDHIIHQLPSTSRDDAIATLCKKAATLDTALDTESLTQAVINRELEMTTALENGIAVPHARLAGLQRPVLLCARTKEGIEWNALDGQPVRMIFLVLTPQDDSNSQLQILRGIAEALLAPEVRQRFLSERDAAGLLETLRNADRKAA